MRQLRAKLLPTSAIHGPVLGVDILNFLSVDPAITSHYPTLQSGLLSRQDYLGPVTGPFHPSSLCFSSFPAGTQSWILTPAPSPWLLSPSPDGCPHSQSALPVPKVSLFSGLCPVKGSGFHRMGTEVEQALKHKLGREAGTGSVVTTP